MLDVVEYAFTEWLVRRGAFSAFKMNYELANKSRKSFREQLRLHIQVASIFPELGLSRLVSSAFPFVGTREGAEFWQKQSDAWKRFCIRFQL